MLLNITALTKTYTISGKLIIALNTVDLTFSENTVSPVSSEKAAAVKQHY